MRKLRSRCFAITSARAASCSGLSRSGCYAFVHRLGRPEQDAALAEVIAKQRERSFRMNRDFHASKPNSKWVTDISYIHTRQGVLYLSMIRDLYDNSIVAVSYTHLDVYKRQGLYR